MPLGTEVNLGPGDVMLDGVATPPLKMAQPPVFGKVYCGQMARWMKTPLGTEVDLGPGHIVLDGVPSFPAKGAEQPPPLFAAHVYCGHGRPSQLLLSSFNCLFVHEISRESLNRFAPNSQGRRVDPSLGGG